MAVAVLPLHELQYRFMARDLYRDDGYFIVYRRVELAAPVSIPSVYVGLSQAPGVYELTLLLADLAQVSFYGSLEEIEAFARSISLTAAEQRQRDAEDRHLTSELEAE